MVYGFKFFNSYFWLKHKTIVFTTVVKGTLMLFLAGWAMHIAPLVAGQLTVTFPPLRIAPFRCLPALFLFQPDRVLNCPSPVESWISRDRPW